MSMLLVKYGDYLDEYEFEKCYQITEILGQKFPHKKSILSENNKKFLSLL